MALPALRVRQEFRRIPPEHISCNPHQPRAVFDPEALRELADSIRRYGIITPLTVRRTDKGFELVAGERRLRAARMVGLATVPCYVVDADEQRSGLMALLENLHRRDLDFFEEAASLRQLCDGFGMTQQEAAERIGKTQSAVANKLRLLRLTPETVDAIRAAGLSERHARALLRLEDPDAQLSAARAFARHGMTVERAEQYVDTLLKPKSAARRQMLLRDVRIFLNTVEHAADVMRRSGCPVELEKADADGALILTVRIPAAAKPS